tara:strand:+ start:1773 stop:2432 length:660 start_codon:yes stop_codon:yes gene_type:complete
MSKSLSLPKVNVIEKSHIILAILGIMHIVGLIGLNSEFQETFQLLTPGMLLLSVTGMLLVQKDMDLWFWLDVILVMFIGFFAEWLGVNYQIIFGNYYYGETLGWKLDGVPLMIAVNWIMVVMASSAAANNIPLPWYMQAFLAAILMVVIDFLIEPIASHFDFWHWKKDIIPTQNFVGWFGVSLLMQLIYFYIDFDKQNKVAYGLYFILFGFFTLLNFTI